MTMPQVVSFDLEQRIRSELQSSEKLLWIGQPAQGIRLRPSDLFLIPFTLMWAGFAVFWEWSVLHTGAPGWFALWGIPFVLVGAYIAVGRFFADALSRSRTCYALTTQRALVLSGLWTRDLKTLWLRNLPEVSLLEGPGDLGSIVFSSSQPQGMRVLNASWPGAARYRPPSFDLIEEPRRVYDLARNAQQAATEAGGG
jgi:hypothetical protein